MKALELYLRSHSQIKGNFLDSSVEYSGWTDYFIDSEMIFSHRKNKYTRETFDEGLHTHGYYELIFYIKGDVEYIQNNKIVRTAPNSVICFHPGSMHTARLISESEYERYVLYFSKEFFSFENETVPMLGFLADKNTVAFNLDKVSSQKMLDILSRIKNELNSKTPYKKLLSKAYLIEIFGILNSSVNDTAEGDFMDDKISEIKNYIDTNYAYINSINEIAEKFFYSREHISREFKSKFNISVSEYLSKRRIIESLKLLKEMSVADACYNVGFKSQSAYISAFVKNIGCLPKEYKKSRNKF